MGSDTSAHPPPLAVGMTPSNSQNRYQASSPAPGSGGPPTGVPKRKESIMLSKSPLLGNESGGYSIGGGHSSSTFEARPSLDHSRGTSANSSTTDSSTSVLPVKVGPPSLAPRQSIGPSGHDGASGSGGLLPSKNNENGLKNGRLNVDMSSPGETSTTNLSGPSEVRVSLENDVVQKEDDTMRRRRAGTLSKEGRDRSKTSDGSGRESGRDKEGRDQESRHTANREREKEKERDRDKDKELDREKERIKRSPRLVQSERRSPKLPTDKSVLKAPASSMYFSPLPTYGHPPNQPLRAHTGTLIGNRIWFIGGVDQKVCWRGVGYMDTETLLWTTVEIFGDSMPGLRAHTATLVGEGLIYIFGGGDGPVYSNDVWIFDTGEWSLRTVEGIVFEVDGVF